MAPFPTGPGHPHIKQSHDGESNLMKFYTTTNATTYGAHFDKFTPRAGKHTGTGYLANFRPQIYYTGRLDKVDNPVMGHIVAGNYKSVKKRDYNPYGAPTGREPFPTMSLSRNTGFVNEKAVTVPNFKSVRKTFIDGRMTTAPADIAPKHRPLLHKIKNKDPVTMENGGHGPTSKSSEYTTRYTGRPWRSVDLAQSSVGPKEATGFTENQKTVEPVCFKQDSPHRNDKPPWMTHRPTGSSIYTGAFRPLEYLHGAEELPTVRNRSSRYTGFTTGAKAHPAFVHRVMKDAYNTKDQIGDMRADDLKKNDPADYLNSIHPDNYSSVSQCLYRGMQKPEPSEADRLGRTAAGFHEHTGHVSNSDSYVQQPEDMSRFITNYNMKFFDVTPVGKDREGHLTWGLHPLPLDGYTKSTKTHDFGKSRDPTAELRGMDPYQARSIKVRDVFHDDHLHDNKLYTTFSRQHTIA